MGLRHHKRGASMIPIWLDKMVYVSPDFEDVKIVCNNCKCKVVRKKVAMRVYAVIWVLLGFLVLSARYDRFKWLVYSG